MNQKINQKGETQGARDAQMEIKGCYLKPMELPNEGGTVTLVSLLVVETSSGTLGSKPAAALLFFIFFLFRPHTRHADWPAAATQAAAVTGPDP